MGWLSRAWTWITTAGNWRWLLAAVGAALMAVLGLLWRRERAARGRAEAGASVANAEGQKQVLGAVAVAAQQQAEQKAAAAQQVEVLVADQQRAVEAEQRKIETAAQQQSARLQETGLDADKMEEMLRGGR